MLFLICKANKDCCAFHDMSAFCTGSQSMPLTLRCAGIESSKTERDTSLTPSHAAHKRKRHDFFQASPGSPASPLTPPALTAFYQGENLPAAASLTGHSVTGHVDAKFDCGYFVSISVEGHEFKGGHACSVNCGIGICWCLYWDVAGSTALLCCLASSLLCLWIKSCILF